MRRIVLHIDERTSVAQVIARATAEATKAGLSEQACEKVSVELYPVLSRLARRAHGLARMGSQMTASQSVTVEGIEFAIQTRYGATHHGLWQRVRSIFGRK
ncbi:MAG: hypothetical protein ACE15C_20225 [Phycisphaerae bacterium]